MIKQDYLRQNLSADVESLETGEADLYQDEN